MRSAKAFTYQAAEASVAYEWVATDITDWAEAQKLQIVSAQTTEASVSDPHSFGSGNAWTRYTALVIFESVEETPQDDTDMTPFQDGIDAALDVIRDRIDEVQSEHTQALSETPRNEQSIAFLDGVISGLGNISNDLETLKSQQ